MATRVRIPLGLRAKKRVQVTGYVVVRSQAHRMETCQPGWPMSETWYWSVTASRCLWTGREARQSASPCDLETGEPDDPVRCGASRHAAATNRCRPPTVVAYRASPGVRRSLRHWSRVPPNDRPTRRGDLAAGDLDQRGKRFEPALRRPLQSPSRTPPAPWHRQAGGSGPPTLTFSSNRAPVRRPRHLQEIAFASDQQF